eukprot:TRINITY_DN3512_c0_g2_i1.p1 TRINITY_DN3512_c0_g2~~TRINITY_DN3512_c0_g2_i1.p1  ORF type:complete len:437 (+),score=118.84 TRINITY_DN3512_c0_g2_i1:43-1353(+)
MINKIIQKKNQKHSHSWTKVSESTRDTEEGRYGHTSFYHNNVFYVVGGSDKDGSFSETILAYSFPNKKWEKLNTNFPARHFHTSYYSDGKAWIFGGKSNGYRNDIWVANVPELDWKEVIVEGDKPSPRYGHTSVVYGGKMFIFGGYENSLSMECDEIWEFTFETKKWKKLNVEGEKPPSRFQHSAVVAQRGGDIEMLVFGGIGEGKNLDDFWGYCFGTNKWSKLKIGGNVPQARSGHSSFYSNRFLFIIGGKSNNSDDSSFHNLLEIDLDKLSGSVIKEENSPSVRFNASIVPFTGEFYFFGGRNKEGKIFDELYKEDMKYSYIGILPKNILLSIFKYLSQKDLSALSQQSRKLYTVATDNFLWKSIAETTGASRYITKDDENKPYCYYRVVNTFVLNIELPPPSGPLVWRNPVMWFGKDAQDLPKRNFLNPSKWK